MYARRIRFTGPERKMIVGAARFRSKDAWLGLPATVIIDVKRKGCEGDHELGGHGRVWYNRRAPLLHWLAG